MESASTMPNWKSSTRPRQKLSVKPKKWSHQHELDQAKGKTVAMMFNGDSLGNAANWRRFTLIETDAYSVKVAPIMRVSDDKSVPTFIVMKHDIKAFMIEE